MEQSLAKYGERETTYDLYYYFLLFCCIIAKEYSTKATLSKLNLDLEALSKHARKVLHVAILLLKVCNLSLHSLSVHFLKLLNLDRPKDSRLVALFSLFLLFLVLLWWLLLLFGLFLMLYFFSYYRS